MNAIEIHNILSQNICHHPDAIVIDVKRSHGCWLFDKRDNTEYLDLFSQFASQPLGWNHPKLMEAAHDLGLIGMVKLANPDIYSEELAEFVKTWSSITPDFAHHFFIDTGTHAVENALKTAFDWKANLLGLDDEQANDLQVIHFEKAFHGRSGYCLSLTNTNPNKTSLFPKFNWPRIECPMDTESEAKALDRIYQCLGPLNHGWPIVAILIETIQGEGGDNHFSSEFLQGLRKLADEYETMLIFDEVQCGMGLTGKMWAYEHFGVVPDIIAFGKKAQTCGISSTKRVDSFVDNVFKNPHRINSTWGGNIVDMVRSTVIIKIIQEDKLVENAALVGDYFLKKLQTLGLCRARGKGLMIAFDCKDGEERDKLIKRMKDNRVLPIGCGDKSIRFRPHLDFTIEAADEAIDRIKKSL